MPDIGDTWTPSMPFPLTDREKKEIKDQEREAERLRNRAKNAARREARQQQRKLPAAKVEAGKMLRHAFGGAFARAPENVKYMAGQGVVFTDQKCPGENEGETNDT